MTTLPLPTPESITRAATELANAATTAAQQRAIRKAEYHLQCGVRLVVTECGLLIPSATTDKVYHYDFIDGSCDCEAKFGCWHQQIAPILERASLYTRPAMQPARMSLADAQAALDECWA